MEGEKKSICIEYRQICVKPVWDHLQEEDMYSFPSDA